MNLQPIHTTLKNTLLTILIVLISFTINAQNNTEILNNNVLNTKENQPTKNSWWQKTTIYQIYPRSFYDSNGDGIGDLKGIVQKLDYIKDLGFETIWISPFFLSPQADFGYDIKDYLTIAPEYGTMEDAELLIDEIHKRNMKIVFDMVMNHTSDQHEWFQQSKQSKDNEKSDWYIWRDEKNNWKSMVGGSAWHYCKERKQYYLATFLPFQPDLNYRNNDVKNAMLNNVRFWLEKGVDGYRLDIFNVIYKDDQFTNNPFTFQIAPNEENPLGFFQKAEFSLNRPETALFAKELRAVSSEFGDKLLLGEVTGNFETIKSYMGNGNINNGLGLVFIFEMLNFDFKAKYFHHLVSEIENKFAEPFTPVYAFSNHDRRRANTRLKNEQEKTKLLHLFQLTVRGVPCVYYGEEIGMEDLKIPYKKGLDPVAQKYKRVPRFITEMKNETLNRDDLRTPMQWSDKKNAGFSSSDSTWLPVNSNFTSTNVETQMSDSTSMLHHFKSLLQIRNTNEAFQSGALELIKTDFSENILGYKRTLNHNSFTVLINFSKQQIQLPDNFIKGKIIYQLENSNQQNLQAWGAIVVEN